MSQGNGRIEGLDEWRKHMLSEQVLIREKLDHLNTKQERLHVHLVKLETEFKIKAGMLGAIFGFIPAIISFALSYLLRK